MGFRRDGKRKRIWDKWRRAHWDVLLQTGLPDDVFEDEASWYFFIEHGYNYTANFTVDQLTLAQANVLHDFLVDQRAMLSGVHVDGLILSLEAQFGLARAALQQS